jgi:CheY-like chemotaxis protein
MPSRRNYNLDEFSSYPTTAVEKTPEARLRVLVVEDNIVNQRLALTLLKRLGWTASLACNGFDAIAALERENFGLVLMDVQMPVMDGLMATREIRRRFRRNASPRSSRSRPIRFPAIASNAWPPAWTTT